MGPFAYFRPEQSGIGRDGGQKIPPRRADRRPAPSGGQRARI